MNGPVRLAATMILVFLPAISAQGQMDYRPAPAPIVTAEHERWYLEGEPVMHAGSIYYPAGPAIHFMPFEMVRSGFYQGIPIYTRTTIEPMSLVFVPVSRGLMQPYERRRDGDLAGTVGSQAPSFPVTRGVAQPGDPSAMIQAPAPPYRAPVFMADVVSNAAPGAAAPDAMQEARPVGTSGTRAWPGMSRAAVRRPGSVNGLFVEYEGARWFSAGPPVDVDDASVTRVGERHGFPVYRRANDPAIYIPITQHPGAPLARYVRR